MRLRDYIKILLSSIKIFAAIGVIFMVGVNGFLYSQAYFAVSVTGTSLPSQTGCWLPPSVPVLVTPTDNYIANATASWTLHPVMVWNASTSSCPGATIQYHYQSSHVPGFSPLAYDSAWLNNPQIPAHGTPEGIYYWHVQARDQWGHVSEYSPAWKLIVDRTAPPVPLLISPGNNVELNSSTLTQTWQQVSDNMGGNVIYNYESYDDPGLGSLRYAANYTNSANGNGQVITKHAEGAPNGDVYWRVRAVDERGNVSGWSQVWHFKIVNTLPNPTPDGSSSPLSSVVLNEVLPDPLGSDSASKPNGEWVELYNNSSSPVDVSGWNITDADANSVLITGDKTNTGGTVVNPHGWLVVYFGTGSILNNNGDAVNLYSGVVLPANLVDSHIYGDTPEGKSIARIPDGSATWYDPIPTPGGPNQLESSTPTPSLIPDSSPNPIPTDNPVASESASPVPTLEPIPVPAPAPIQSPEPQPTETPVDSATPILTPNE